MDNTSLSWAASNIEIATSQHVLFVRAITVVTSSHPTSLSAHSWSLKSILWLSFGLTTDCTCAELEPRCHMAVEKQLVNSRSDENFRKGAYHAAEWLLHASRTQAAQGHTATEVSEHLSQLLSVLADWRAQMVPLPDGNPWDWSLKDLASVIKARQQD